MPSPIVNYIRVGDAAAWYDLLGAVLRHVEAWGHRAGASVVVYRMEGLSPAAGSPRPFTMTIDLSTLTEDRRELGELAKYMRMWLPDSYEVVDRETHVRIESAIHWPVTAPARRL